MPPVRRSEKPQWAVEFKARRERVGISQEEMALRAEVSQSLISQIERGVQKLNGLSVERLLRLADALQWSPAEMQQATGVDLGHPAQEDQPVHQSRVPAREIPDELQQAIEIYGKRYPDLLEPDWQNYLASFRNRGMETDSPEEWLDLYRNLVRHNIQPGVEN